jgi:hypothetical protein
MGAALGTNTDTDYFNMWFNKVLKIIPLLFQMLMERILLMVQ